MRFLGSWLAASLTSAAPVRFLGSRPVAFCVPWVPAFPTIAWWSIRIGFGKL
ncbi:hypothetical protein Aph02nite_92200 [Actinoplanes philippinensis]|nr:hypothetical protein Aph02nite_92200 [Actinoplanes philippinensis]